MVVIGIAFVRALDARETVNVGCAKGHDHDFFGSAIRKGHCLGWPGFERHAASQVDHAGHLHFKEPDRRPDQERVIIDQDRLRAGLDRVAARRRETGFEINVGWRNRG